MRNLLVCFLFLAGVAACGKPEELRQQQPQGAELESATRVAQAVAGRSYAGRWGSGDYTVDVTVTLDKNFRFDPSGGGQTLKLTRNSSRGKGPYSTVFAVVSMRSGGNTISLVSPADGNMVFTTTLSVSPDGRTYGNISGWNPSSGSSGGMWDASLKEEQI